jgi:hypothetical protein
MAWRSRTCPVEDAPRNWRGGTIHLPGDGWSDYAMLTETGLTQQEFSDMLRRRYPNPAPAADEPEAGT